MRRLILRTIKSDSYFLQGPFNAKLKDKEKKEPSRQSTLFGLPLGKSIEKQNRKKKTADANNESQSVEPEATVTSDHKALPYTQTSDITMVEEPTEEVETQPLEEQFESQNESQDAPDSVVEDQTMDMVRDPSLLTGKRDNMGCAGRGINRMAAFTTGYKWRSSWS